MIMKQLLGLILIMSMSFSLMAQTKDSYTEASESDPRAQAILDKIRNKYEGYKTVQANFSLAIEIPEQDKIVQKGKMSQAGDNYRVEMQDQSIISNGTILWYHQINNNEVQINDVEEDSEDMLSPKDLMKIYEKEDYVYALINEYSEKGKVIQQVEFKPTEENSEYIKIRLTIDKKKMEIARVKVFARDGSRYTFTLDEFTPNKTFPENYFVFDASKFPGIHVEDLRID